MARTPFKVEILTPEGEVFNDEVEMVSTKTAVGSIGLLANHQPLLAMLDPTELRLYKSESDVVRYAQGEGFLQISGTHALVLVDEVFEVDELDSGDLKDRLKQAEDELDKAEEGTEELRAAERDEPPLRGVPEDRRLSDVAEGERRRRSSLAWQAKPSSEVFRMDERALTERLITYDTSNVDGLRAAAGFVKGWLEAREIDVVDHRFGDLHALSAMVGPEERPDARLPRPLRRRPRPRGAVHPPRRGRPADRARRLRHEGRARLDDVRHPRRRRRRTQVRVRLRDRARRGVRGHRAPHQRRPRPPRPRRRLRDHRRADRPARRDPGQGRARRAAWWCTGGPRTARRRGWATTPC